MRQGVTLRKSTISPKVDGFGSVTLPLSFLHIRVVVVLRTIRRLCEAIKPSMSSLLAAGQR
jgi:hypothetical protein